MKHYLIVFMVLFSLPVLCISCSTDDPLPETGQSIPPAKPEKPEDDTSGNPSDENDNNDNNGPMRNQLKITVGNLSFTATLDDNASASAFKALLPITVNMAEMNGNEKYYYLPGNLPTASYSPGSILSGDLMLYGSSCLVLFYDTFHTSYNYTRLGRIDNAVNLPSALGNGSVTVTFDIQ